MRTMMNCRRSGLLDKLIEELNKDRPEEEKIVRLHSQQYQICSNGAKKGTDGKFVKES